jgi:hypothetical protein
VRTLSVKVLKKEIDVPIPGREVQMRVVDLAKLAARESELVLGIDSVRKKFLESVLVKHIAEKS